MRVAARLLLLPTLVAGPVRLALDRAGDGPAHGHRRHRRDRPRRPRRAVVLALVVVAWPSLGSAAWLSSAVPSPTGAVAAGVLGSVTAPVPAQVPGGRTVSLSWAAVDLATHYEVRHHDAAVGGTSEVVCSTSTTSCLDTTPRSAGGHWYSLIARRGTGWSSTSGRAVHVPDLATSISATGLLADTGTSATDRTTRTATNAVHGTAEPGATVAVRRAGSTVATAVADSGGAWTSSTFDLVEGAETLDLVATDVFGSTASTSLAVRLDTVAPTVTQFAPCGTPGAGAWCRQTTLSVTASATDAGSGLAAGTTERRLDGGAWSAYSGAFTVTEGAARVVDVRASDVAGNVGTSTATYHLDATGPVLSGTMPSGGTSLSLALLGTSCSGAAACGAVTDATSGLVSAASSVAWTLRRSGLFGDSCYVVATGWGSCTGVVPQPAAGTLPTWRTPMGTGIYAVASSYTLTVQATDAAGNTTTQVIAFSTVL